MAHTPEPWRQHPDRPDRIIVNGCCVYEVRQTTSEDGTPNPSDVALMAAAPALLDALRRCVWWLRDLDNDICEKAELLNAEDAISRAEGRSK